MNRAGITPIVGLVLSLALIIIASTQHAYAADVSRGQSIYKRACSACHGNAGDGRGPAARYLDPRPRDFTFGLYKFRSTPTGMLPTDDDLYRTVTDGIPTTSMPAFEQLLSEAERRDVVAYIKSFSDNFELMPSADPIQIPDELQATAQSVADGRSIYMITGCWTCHGPRGTGEGDAATVLKDVSGFDVRPVDFTKGHYKGGRDAVSIFRTIETGVMGTPMPGYAAAFGFASDNTKLPGKIESVYSADDIVAVRSFLAKQPTKAEMNSMPEADRDRLHAQRKWALVHYLQSLAEPPSMWSRLFVEDTEVTR